MIYYFSATGNSKHVANRLSEALGIKKINILDALNKEINIDEKEKFILIYPNYCGGVPYVIKDFLQKSKFHIQTNSQLICIITYGNNTGASYSISSKYFKKNTNRSFDAMYSVKMPDNWTPVFDLTNKDEVDEINRLADLEINKIIEKIKNDERGDFVNDKLGKKMELIYSQFYKTLSKTKHLNVEDSCIGCGLCADKCPIHAIEIKEGKPFWNVKNCLMCLGCLHRCPTFSIQYDNKTKTHGQYLHPDIKE